MSTLPLLPSTQGCFLTCSKKLSHSLLRLALKNLVQSDPLMLIVIQKLLKQRPALAWDLFWGKIYFCKLKKNIDHDLQLSRFQDWTWFWCLGCNPKMMSPSPLNGTSPPTFNSFFIQMYKKIKIDAKFLTMLKRRMPKPHTVRGSALAIQFQAKKREYFCSKLALDQHRCVVPHTCIFG